MFKGERTSLIGVAFETRNVVPADQAHAGIWKAAVRVVTICAMDSALRELMSERLLKPGPNRRMTARAEGVAGPAGFLRMNAMAQVAADAVAVVRGIKAARLFGVCLVAAQTHPVYRSGLAAFEERQLVGIQSFDMRQTRPMARFASVVVVHIAFECFRLRLVAYRAPVRPDKSPLRLRIHAHALQCQ